MIHAVLICISIAILGVCWFLYRRNIELFLCLLIAIYSELFYLIPQIKGPEDYKLLLLPIIIILMVESLFTGKLSLGRYGWWVISFLGISVFGVIVAYFSGQSLTLGIKAAKFIPLVLVYFLLAGRQINIGKLATYFVVMSLAIAAIATVQYFIHGINFFPGMPEAMKIARLENPRITVGQFVIATAAVVSFSKYIRSVNWFFLFAAAMLFFDVLFIQQTRVFIAGVFVSMVIVYLLSRKLTVLRVSSYLILAGLFMSTFLIASADLYNVELVKRTASDIAQGRGSFQARINAYNHYWQEIQKRPVLGHGLLNFNWEGNKARYLQQEKGIHLSDIGITQFFVQAGIIGFVWFLYGLCKIWYDILRCRKYVLISSYFILATITMPTIDMFLRIDSMFVFAAFLGIFSRMAFADKAPSAAKVA